MARKNHNEEAMVAYFMDNFDTDREFSTGKETIEEACAIALKDYMRVTEYPANLHYLPQLASRVADHLSGLPSPFHPEYVNWNIEQQLKEWGVLPLDANDRKVRMFIDQYHKYWAVWIIEKANKFNKKGA